MMRSFASIISLLGLAWADRAEPRQRGDHKWSDANYRLNQATTRHVRPICDISGVAGMSVGVMHHGKVIYRDNLGLRNANGEVVPDSQTIYSIGSLTKAFSAAAIANLLEGHDGIDFDTPVDQILPEYEPQDERLRGQVSLGDFLSHRSGLLGDMSFVLQGQLEFLLPPDQLLPTLSRLETIAPIRRAWSYNNWGYSVASAVIEKLSGKSYTSYINETLIQPLDLKNTTSQPAYGPGDNFADAHISLCNAKPLPFEKSFFFKDSLFEAAGGIYSNVDDMLSWSKAVLTAEKEPSGGPLRHVSTIISNQIPLDNPSHDFRFYGMGWIRTQLPGVVGLQGDNPELFAIKELPILGAGAAPMMTYYHQGSAPGYYSALFLFPETESAVVVLTNSIPLNDAADWIAQVYISALFDFPDPADYVGLARESRKRKLDKFDRVLTTFEQIRREHPGEKPVHSLDTYAGSYFNDAGNFYIEVRQHPHVKTSLELRFQGRDSQRYELRHLYADVFEWAMTCDESARHARYPILSPEYFEVHFQFEADHERPASLTWAAIELLLPHGIQMTRKDHSENEQTHRADGARGPSIKQSPLRR